MVAVMVVVMEEVLEVEEMEEVEREAMEETLEMEVYWVESMVDCLVAYSEVEVAEDLGAEPIKNHNTSNQMKLNNYLLYLYDQYQGMHLDMVFYMEYV